MVDLETPGNEFKIKRMLYFAITYPFRVIVTGVNVLRNFAVVQQRESLTVQFDV